MGAAVAFVANATAGPMKPMRAITPIRPIRAIAPIRPIFAIASIRPVWTLTWSKVDMDTFMASH